MFKKIRFLMIADIAVAEDAATRLRVPFLVVDFARTLDGRWIVIECNDAQESGYAAVHPASLWRSVLQQIGDEHKSSLVY